MKGGNDTANEEIHARKLKAKHNLEIQPTTPDLSYSNENMCKHLENKKQ